MSEEVTETPKRRGRPPKAKVEESLIEVICVRRIGLKDRTAKVGEKVEIERDDARKLQDVGAIKVLI